MRSLSGQVAAPETGKASFRPLLKIYQLSSSMTEFPNSSVVATLLTLGLLPVRRNTKQQL